ncbi:MAG: hypothetical protein V2A79_05415 [Planctomycetota bacterium]
MPIKRTPAKPAHGHPELVGLLVDELRHDAVAGPPGSPLICEEEQRFGGLHVTVIWDRWREVPDKAERGAIILDAYVEAGRVQDAKRIRLVLGLTEEEAKKLKIEY